VLFAALLGCAAGAVAAGANGVATIIEGKAVVIRGLSRFDVAPGVRLQADDLLRTGKDTFLRIEYDDGVKVDLGSETALQLNPPARRKSDRPGLYVLSGWVKLISGKTDGHASYALGSPQFDIFDVAGAVVAHVEPGAGAVFAEQGHVRCVDRRGRGAGATSLRSGDFIVLHRDEAVAVQGRPAPDFVAALPRQFRDPIPGIIDHFARETLPKGQGPFTYAEVEGWLDAEPAIRRQFVRLWHARADEEAFRTPLEQALARHPEWGPVLYPELYEPKPKPVAATAGPSAASGVPAPVEPATVPAAVPVPSPAGQMAGPLPAPVLPPQTESPGR
jgi:hypothetical protein